MRTLSMMIFAGLADEGKSLSIEVVSFGFKYGVPLQSDLLIDVRFLPNPYYIPELKALDGKNLQVQEFVNKWPETQKFLEKYFSLLDFLVPLYKKEGKSCLTISVGCTGGKHRSVTIAEKIYGHLDRGHGRVTLTHRDIYLGSYLGLHVLKNMGYNCAILWKRILKRKAI